MFDRIRPIGEWVDETTLDGSELEAFDTDHVASIDGVNGGAYDPTEVIEIGGEGLSVHAAFGCTEVATLHQVVVTEPGVLLTAGGQTQLGYGGGLVIENGAGGLTVGGETETDDVCGQFDGNVHVTGSFIVGTHDTTPFSWIVAKDGLIASFANVFELYVGSDPAIDGSASGNIHATGNIFADGTLDVEGTSSFEDLASFSGSVAASFTGAVLVSKPIICSGEGRMRKRITISAESGPTTSVSYSVAESDIVMIAGDGVLAGPVEWRILEDGALEGDEMFLSRQNDNGAHFITVVRDIDSTQIIVMGKLINKWARIAYTGGSWKLVAVQGDAADTI